MKYYLSNSGNDSNDGSIFAPWASLSKISSLKAGDSIYLKCGDTFYGNIVTPTLNATDDQVTISSYGFGNKPIITAYKILNISSAWTLSNSPNVWKIDISNTSNFTGYLISDVNIGFLKVNGSIFPNKKDSIDKLTALWDFYLEGNYMYVYSTNNPANYNVKAAPAKDLVSIGNSARILNLDIVGSGTTGIFGRPINSYIGSCDIHELGGSVLTTPYYSLRYGNGITFWQTAQDTLIEYNNIYDCYDVAFSMQGDIVGIGFKNIRYQNNFDWNNEQSFEVWTQKSVANTGFFNCYFENNVSINAGYGWSYSIRADNDSATSLYLQMMEAPVTDITIRNNVFYNPRGGLISVKNSTTPIKVPSGFISKENYIFLKTGNLVDYNNNKTYSINDYSSYVASSGQEINSQFIILTTAETLIPKIISSIESYLSPNFLKSLNYLNGKIEGNKNLDFIKKTTKGIEMMHMNGLMKVNGGYVTNFTKVKGDYYAPLLKFTTSYVYGRFDMVMNYTIVDDSIADRKGVGTVNLQIIGDQYNAQVNLNVFEIFDLTCNNTAQDFVAVIEKQDKISSNQGIITVGLYFNVGKQNYVRLAYQPTLLFSEDDISRTNYVFYDKADLLTTLPVLDGTQPIIATSASTYVKSSKPGNAPPNFAPKYIGQEYIDITNKKVYKAIGLTISDWLALN